MDQKERFRKSGDIEYQIHEAVGMLEQGIELLNKASWYCRETSNVSDGNRNENINNEVYILVERIKDLHNYWQNTYDEMENDEYDY